MDAAVLERGGEGLIYEPVLLHERQAAEARAHDRYVKVVTGSRAVEDGELARVRKSVLEELLEPRGHPFDLSTR
jgi:hypothetical protein